MPHLAIKQPRREVDVAPLRPADKLPYVKALRGLRRGRDLRHQNGRVRLVGGVAPARGLCDRAAWAARVARRRPHDHQQAGALDRQGGAVGARLPPQRRLDRPRAASPTRDPAHAADERAAARARHRDAEGPCRVDYRRRLRRTSARSCSACSSARRSPSSDAGFLGAARARPRTRTCQRRVASREGGCQKTSR